jgi:hypothetical protein
VAGAQALAGAGNLVFALATVWLFAPAQLAPLAAFLALFVVVHTPALSLAAGAAQRPGWTLGVRRTTWRTGLGAGAALALAAPLLAPALGLPLALVVALAVAIPVAPRLALARARLVGEGRSSQAVASLLAEPALRLGLGIPAALVSGSTGAAVAVVLASYGALAVAGWDRPRATTEAERAFAPAAVPWSTIAAFLALAAILSQDLVWANAMLAAGQAASFAVLSTVGGIAAFATATVPLVMLPRTARGEGGAPGPAVAFTAAAGLGAMLLVAVAPGAPGAVFGSAYADVAALLPRYVVAMALLGLVHVLVADRFATGAGGSTLALLLGGATVHAGLLVAVGDDPAAIANCTLAVTGTLASALGAPAALRGRRPSVSFTALRVRLRRPEVVAVGTLTLLALVSRLVIDRGLWLDEATGVVQAQLPFGDMLAQMRHTDINPPLHQALLWLTVRTAGNGELAVRLPSLVAGSLLVPMLYLAGRELYGHRAGWFAGLAGVLSPLAVWYSQEARMYSVFMLFALLAVWMQVRVLRHGRRTDWVLYTLATVALLWTQYFGLLQVVAQQLVFAAVFAQRLRSGEGARTLAAGWAASTLVVAILCLPLVGLASDQLEAYLDRRDASPSSVGAAVAPSLEHLTIYAGIANGIWMVWGYHSDATMLLLGALWPLTMLGALFVLGRGWSMTSTLVAAAAVVPVLVLFGLGLVRRDLFEVRYVAGAVPLIALLVGRLLASFRPGGRTAWVASGLVAASLALGLADQQLNRTNPRFYDFEGAVGAVARMARPGDVVIYSPAFMEPVLQYYGPDLDTRPIASTRSALRAPGRVIVVASFLDRPEIAKRTAGALALIERRRYLQVRIDKPQVKVWVLG